MPILDVELVCASEEAFRAVSAAAVADAAGKLLACAPGRAWVRLRYLPRTSYAENGMTLADGELPVFVTVLHAQPPVGDALDAEALALTQAIAEAVGRPRERVHVQYAPAAAGRQAFGGVIVKARS